jgi:hypothetical protein
MRLSWPGPYFGPINLPAVGAWVPPGEQKKTRDYWREIGPIEASIDAEKPGKKGVKMRTR